VASAVGFPGRLRHNGDVALVAVPTPRSRSSSVRTGKTIIQINGLMRSGNHAIIRWLTSLFDDCQHLNNLEHDFFVYPDRLAALMANPHPTIICSFEDFPRYYNAAFVFRDSIASPATTTFPKDVVYHKFFILRDVYNCLASRIHSHIVDSGKSASDVDRFLENWLDLSHHYLENPNNFILYNK